MPIQTRSPRASWVAPCTLLLALACGGQPPQETLEIQGSAKPAAVVAMGAELQARASEAPGRCL